MKRSLLLFLLALSLLSYFPSLSATLLGGGFTWKSRGQDTFLISLTLYKDCNDTSAMDTVRSMVVSGCSSAIKIPLTLGTPKVRDISQNCPNQCNKCSDPKCSYPYGIQEYVYTMKFVITGTNKKCCEWDLSYQGGKRSGGFNIAKGGPFYTEAKLNRCSKPADNSPQFNATPLMIFPTNQCITYNLGVTDPDVDANGFKDFLVYSFTTILDSANTPSSVNTPYTWDKPFDFQGFPNKDSVWGNSCSGLHIDSLTGDINFKAPKPTQGIISILVKEYGKDLTGKSYLKGIVRREQPVIFTNQINNPPGLSGINGTQKFDSTICNVGQVCYTINSYDSDSTDTVGVRIISAPAKTKLSTETNKKHPRSIICWTSNGSDDTGNPITLILEAHNNGCTTNMVSRTRASYNFNVLPVPKVLVIDSSFPCGLAKFYAFPKKGKTITSYLWTGDDSLFSTDSSHKHQYQRKGILNWELKTTNNFGCTNTDKGTIGVYSYYSFPKAVTITGDTDVCQSTQYSYKLAQKVNANYYWTVKNGIIISGQGTNKINVIWNTGTSGFVKLWMTDFQGCYSITNLYVKIKPTVFPGWSVLKIAQDEYKFVADDTTFLDYHWTFGDGQTDSNNWKVIHKYAQKSIYDVQLRVTIANGCSGTTKTQLDLQEGIPSRTSTLLFFKISPNPFDEQTNITYSLSKPANVMIILADMQGREMQTIMNQKQNAGEFTQNLNTAKSGIVPGNYILKVLIDGELTTHQLIKLN